MSQWLRISNPGCFDVASAVNMLGASVKVTNTPIGMFGSGTKYALAQSVRSRCEVKIYDGQNMFNVSTSLKDFRDRTFLMIALNAKGKRIVTPITTEFGAKDWTDDWFIFREFYANALDEGQAKLDLVDKVEATPDSTSVFLPYERFSHIYKNLDKYFTTRPNWDMWVGDGSMYRQGVFIGKIEGTTINYHCSSIKINECRVMDIHDAIGELSYGLADCKSEEVWTALFNSTDEFKSKLSISIYRDATYDAIHKALVNVYGENYCICPKVDEIINDAKAMGMTPVVLPDTFLLDDDRLHIYLKMDNAKVVRKMSDAEQAKYDTVRNKISAFIPKTVEVSVRVFSEGLERVLGDADIGGNEIRIRDSIFNDERELIHTVIHEIGHIMTRAGDYDRRFCSFFIDKLVDISI